MAQTPEAVVAASGVQDGFARHRELLANLIRKELKVKYKNSTLGFVWSLMNPLLYLVIFSVVLVGFLRVALPWYHFYLLSGLVAWNFFANSLTMATGAVVMNSSLVTKVYFRREVLPLSSIGAGMVHFLLQLGVLVAAMLVFNYNRFWDEGLVLLPLALTVQIVLLIGFGLICTSLNVYYRDVQHLLELALLAWFWLTPIVYPVSLAMGRFWDIYLLNPMTPIVLAFHRALYSQVTVVEGGELVPVLVEAPLTWYLMRLGYVALFALALVTVGWWVFRRLDRRLAEEL